MLIKRSIFIILMGSIIMTLGASSSMAMLKKSDESSINPASISSSLDAEVQLSPGSTVAANRFHPAVAYNSKHGEFLVVWHNLWPGGTRDIYARRVSRIGNVLSWFCVTTGTSSRSQPALAYNYANDEYLVVWMQETSPNIYEIWGKIIPWNGPGTNADFRIVTWTNRSFWSPKVAWNIHRNEYLVLSNAFNTTVGFPPGIPNDIGGYRISASGVVLNPGVPIQLTSSDFPNQVDLVYNWMSGEYFIAYVVSFAQPTNAGNDIYGLRVSQNGVPISPPGLIHITIPGYNEDAPQVAFYGDSYVVAYEHEITPSNHDIYVTALTLNGAEEYWSIITSSANDSTSPDISFFGTDDKLIVWQEMVPGGTAIKALRWGPYESKYFDVANYAFWDNASPAVSDNPGLIAYEGDSSTTDRHIYGRIWWPVNVFMPFIDR